MTNGDRARHMLETSIYADCEFVVGGDDVSQRGISEYLVYLVQFNVSQCYYHVSMFVTVQLIKAHQIFLAMGSPVFEAMFYGGMAQPANNSNADGQNQPISIRDLQPSAFKDLLEYLFILNFRLTETSY